MPEGHTQAQGEQFVKIFNYNTEHFRRQETHFKVIDRSHVLLFHARHSVAQATVQTVTATPPALHLLFDIRSVDSLTRPVSPLLIQSVSPIGPQPKASHPIPLVSFLVSSVGLGQDFHPLLNPHLSRLGHPTPQPSIDSRLFPDIHCAG